MYSILKTLHLIGVVLLIGNVTVSAVWKVFADRTGDAGIMHFAQRLITLADWWLTLPGIILIVAGGYGMLFVAGASPVSSSWLINGQLLFALSGAIWLAILIPEQIRLARQPHSFAKGGEIPRAYRIAHRRWLFWGVVATVPLVAATYLMTAKI